ncbi:hypothetical protein LINGRAHAP2_LOCUS29174 [Linum grandiflorum]
MEEDDMVYMSEDDVVDIDDDDEVDEDDEGGFYGFDLNVIGSTTISM